MDDQAKTSPNAPPAPAAADMPVHPAAQLFPLMEPRQLDQLAESIRDSGQRLPIVLCDGKILDGRNRWLACASLGIEPRTVEWDGVGSPWRFVWDHNGQRRDLPADRRVAIWVELKQADETWHAEQRRLHEAANRARSEATKLRPRVDTPFGSRLAPASDDPQESEITSEPSRLSCDKSPGSPEHAHTRLAAETGTSPTTCARVLAIAKQRPDLFSRVVAGEMSATEAARQAKRDRVAERCGALPTSTRYRVIYADPPWEYGDTRAGLAGYAATAAADHYPTMSVKELCALDVRELADDDAVLFCWATFPLLDDALTVVKAWGFSYKTAFVWSKGRANLGHYHNASAELLLVATRGSCLPDAEAREDQVQAVKRTGRHSEKPEHFRQLIDRLYPHGRRIELFRRGDVPEGWDTWGNEASAP